jgi:hypothetical protein
MSSQIDLTKDPSRQQPVPTVWRKTLAAIVESIRTGDFQLAAGIPGVPKLTANTADHIEQSLGSYGANLDPLPDSAWDTSVCQWMGGYWELLVDLYTAEEGSSDLALFARVRESGSSFSFEVISVHVP